MVRLSRVWVAVLSIFILTIISLTWVYFRNSQSSLTFNAFDDPQRIDPSRALAAVTIKPTSNVGPNSFVKLKVIYERSQPAICPNGYNPTVQMPFYKKVIADRIERDGDPYQREVGVSTIKNFNYPGKIILGQDKLFTTQYSSDSSIIYAKYIELYEKTRNEPNMIDKAIAMSFENWYDESSLIGKLDRGNKIDISKTKPIKICEKASGGGSGGGG